MEASQIVPLLVCILLTCIIVDRSMRTKKKAKHRYKNITKKTLLSIIIQGAPLLG